MMRVLHLECLFPEFNWDDDTPLVSCGIVHVLDIIHYTLISRQNEYIFSPFPVALILPQPLIPEPDQRIAEPGAFQGYDGHDTQYSEILII